MRANIGIAAGGAATKDTEAVMGADGAIALPARQIPIPESISPAAQDFLRSQSAPRRQYPAPGDLAGWRSLIDSYDRTFAEIMAPKLRAIGVPVERTTINGVSVHVGSPPQNPGQAEAWVNLSLHGGALVFAGGELVAADAAMAVHRTGCRSFAVDYRMPPDHPFPAGLEDCIAAYRGLLERYVPAKIVVSGRSAGGNLAAAMILRLRELGLPLPGAAILLTPEVDLTESGDSFQTLRSVDVVLKSGLPEANALYAQGHDLRDPAVSPLFGDFTKGFPPTLIQSGTRDLFLSNAVRMHRALRAAGVEAELHVWEAMPHGDFGGFTREDKEIWAELRSFLARHRAGESPAHNAT
jgi:monoterpene epsilon-lactone hydrolase